MKLKKLLTCAFLALTLIPIAIVSVLLYKSGYNLSEESYTRNLIESINVQSDYISQTIENNIIGDYRFANQKCADYLNADNKDNKELLKSFQAYLEASEDKISVCMLLDKNNEEVYTIGEKSLIDAIKQQVSELSMDSEQQIVEFKLAQDVYSLGIVTQINDAQGDHLGRLISVYDKSYIFKIISSYYEIADTSTYICRQNGDIINFRGLADESRNKAVEQALTKLNFENQDKIDVRIGDNAVTGYYKKISNSPWYLVGFIDDSLIFAFTNQFIWVYILIIAGVLAVDVVLSLYISKKVVEPINGLMKIMDEYKTSLNINELKDNKKGYAETQYLKSKFFSLMNRISLVQHNFEGIYQLYQSSIMDDTNIDIDTKNQTAVSNKEVFQKLMDNMVVNEGDCVVERFIHCFCEKDRDMLRKMLEGMRDEHLSTAREAEVYTHYLNQRWFHILVVPMYENDHLARMFIQLRDISNFKKQELQSFEQARKDSLTGLYNRSGFIECVNNALQNSDKSQQHGLLFIDIDYFKLVNDNFGHAKGDELLCDVGEVLKKNISDDNIVSRFGGDEFAIFLINTTPEEIEKTKNLLKEKLIYPFKTDKTAFVVSASIGVSVWNSADENTLENLIQQADSAMYKAKRDFKENSEKSKENE